MLASRQFLSPDTYCSTFHGKCHHHHHNHHHYIWHKHHDQIDDDDDDVDDEDDGYHLAFPKPLNRSLVLAWARRPGQWHKEALQKWSSKFLKISSWTELHLHQVSKTPGDDGVVVAGHVEGNRPTSEAKAAQIWTYLAKK